MSALSDRQALDSQLALAKGDPHADGPDAGDFLRQQVDALRRDDEPRARVYALCAKRQFRVQQAEARALSVTALEHGPDFEPAA